MMFQIHFSFSITDQQEERRKRGQAREWWGEGPAREKEEVKRGKQQKEFGAGRDWRNCWRH